VLRWTDLDQVPAGFGPSIVTIGNFDGVHLGHAAVLRTMVTQARASGERAVAVTFDPHPAAVHRPGSAPVAITGLADRLDLLEATGLDATLVLRYTLEFARQTPEEFVRDCLVVPLGMSRIVVGRDVRFGLDNSGTLVTMRELGERYGFEVEVIEDVGDGSGAVGRCSSTQVRARLDAGDVAGAAALLGRDHLLRGTVVHGDERGRELGFPTANLGGEVVGFVPADGVYAGRLRRDAGRGETLPAAVSIGTNPTFDGTERRIEAYVLDRTDLDLYGEDVVLELVGRVRGQVRFDGVDALVAQMDDDVEKVRPILA